MAITRSFGGQTLLKPGAYSVSRVDNAQSLATGDNDTIMLIGEAVNGTDSGSAGGEGTARMFSASQVQGLIDYYGEGDIVDAALAAVRPSITPGVSGPGVFIVYKTNAGAVASQIITITAPPAAGDILRFRVPVNASGETANVDLVWGTDIPVATSAILASDNIAVAVSASPALRNFFTAVSPAASAQVTFTAIKQGPEFNNIGTSALLAGGASAAGWLNLFDNINAPLPFTGGAANLGSTTGMQLTDAYADAFNFEPNVIVPLWSNPAVAPASAALGSLLIGGSGFQTTALSANLTISNAGSATNNFNVAFTSATADAAGYATAIAAVLNGLGTDVIVDYTWSSNGDSIVATADTAGSASNLLTFSLDTFSAGTITATATIVNSVLTPIANGNPNAGTSFEFIDASIAAAGLQSHLIERSSTSVRREAQGMIGGRFADWRSSYSSAFATAEGVTGFSGITSFLIQAFIQDVRIFDSAGMLTWKAPHIMAAQAAGIRLGTTVGEPLTFKFVNANAVAHHVNTETGNFSGSTQFRPGFDFNVAILNGITFTEIASGGNRIVVDNTRYIIDDESFVFNRGSVIEAAQFVARTSRELLERIFVGQKVSNGAALSLKNVLRNYLIQLNTDNIITTSSDAPFGFVEETFTVTINGNTAAIQVEIKPVQGLDFIFIDFTLGNITQSA